jgi:hypothetical protein
VDAAKGIHELTLVLVNALDLDVKERVATDGESGCTLNVRCQTVLVINFALL